MSAENVRDQRASETLWTMSPILKGIRRRAVSQSSRPFSVRFQRLKNCQDEMPMIGIVHHQPLAKFDMATVTLVMVGRSPPNCLKMPAKTGTRNVTRAKRTS